MKTLVRIQLNRPAGEIEYLLGQMQITVVEMYKYDIKKLEGDLRRVRENSHAPSTTVEMAALRQWQAVQDLYSSLY